MRSHSIRVSTGGFASPTLRVPPLSINSGEIVRLVSPRHASVFAEFEKDKELRDSFQVRSDRQIENGMLLQPWIEFPPGWKFLFRRALATDWIEHRTGLARDEAATLLRRFHVEPEMPLCHMAGNPRGLMALASVLVRRPAVIVFHTMGLDPLGQDRLLQTAFDEIGDAAGIYCQSRVFSRRAIERHLRKFQRSMERENVEPLHRADEQLAEEDETVVEPLDFPFAQSVFLEGAQPDGVRHAARASS